MKSSFCFFCAAIVVFSGAAALAEDYEWVGGNGGWNDSRNWTPEGIPGSGDTAKIGAGTVEWSGGGWPDSVTIYTDAVVNLRSHLDWNADYTLFCTGVINVYSGFTITKGNANIGGSGSVVLWNSQFEVGSQSTISGFSLIVFKDSIATITGHDLSGMTVTVEGGILTLSANKAGGVNLNNGGYLIIDGDSLPREANETVPTLQLNVLADNQSRVSVNGNLRWENSRIDANLNITTELYIRNCNLSNNLVTVDCDGKLVLEGSVTNDGIIEVRNGPTSLTSEIVLSEGCSLAGQGELFMNGTPIPVKLTMKDRSYLSQILKIEGDVSLLFNNHEKKEEASWPTITGLIWIGRTERSSLMLTDSVNRDALSPQGIENGIVNRSMIDIFPLGDLTLWDCQIKGDGLIQVESNEKDSGSVMFYNNCQTTNTIYRFGDKYPRNQKGSVFIHEGASLIYHANALGGVKESTWETAMPILLEPQSTLTLKPPSGLLKINSDFEINLDNALLETTGTGLTLASTISAKNESYVTFKQCVVELQNENDSILLDDSSELLLTETAVYGNDEISNQNQIVGGRDRISGTVRLRGEDRSCGFYYLHNRAAIDAEAVKYVNFGEGFINSGKIVLRDAGAGTNVLLKKDWETGKSVFTGTGSISVQAGTEHQIKESSGSGTIFDINLDKNGLEIAEGANVSVWGSLTANAEVKIDGRYTVRGWTPPLFTLEAGAKLTGKGILDMSTRTDAVAAFKGSVSGGVQVTGGSVQYLEGAVLNVNIWGPASEGAISRASVDTPWKPLDVSALRLNVALTGDPSNPAGGVYRPQADEAYVAIVTTGLIEGRFANERDGRIELEDGSSFAVRAEQKQVILENFMGGTRVCDWAVF